MPPCLLPYPRTIRHCCALALLVLSPWLAAQEVGYRVQTEAQVSLSLAQEADEAIDRAQRWLHAQPAETNRLENLLLRRYALATPQKPFVLQRCDLSPLEQALPAPAPASALTNLTTTLTRPRITPKELFALQASLLEAPSPSWREDLVTHLVNAQRIDASGGTWGSVEDTIWAILTLRALLNESVPLDIR